MEKQASIDGRGMKLTARGGALVQAGGQVLRALSIVVESVGSAAEGRKRATAAGGGVAWLVK